MVRFASSLQAIRIVGLALLVFGLLVRAAIPSGYMLERSEASNMLEMRLCGAGMGETYASFNPVTREWVKLDASDREKPDQDGDQPKTTPHSCEFALSMVADLAEAKAFPVAVVFGAPFMGSKVYVSESHRPVITAPLPARGPPSLI